MAISRKGRRELRTRTKYLFRGGFLRCVRTVVLTPVEMTWSTIDRIKAFPLGGRCRAATDEGKAALLKPSPSGARRGGAKHRKNSPRVTVFSQSGEAAMLRAGQALATWQSHGREYGRCGHEKNTFTAGDFSAAFGLSSSLRSK